jgi:hypothetical protein
MHIGFWNQNVREEEQVCIWVLKQNVGFQKNIRILIEKEEAGFQGTCWVYSILQCLVVGAPKTLSQIC